MKYCPACDTEYNDEVASCADCGGGLVGPADRERILKSRESEASEEFVTVKTVDDRFEADVIRDALEKEGIPVLVRCFSDTSFDGIYIAQKGWGAIQVPSQYLKQAEDIVCLLG